MDYKWVLSLHYAHGFSSRFISDITGDGKSTINDFLKRFRENEYLSWPLSEDITNEMIEEMLYQKPGNAVNDNLYRSFDEEEVHRKLARKGETLIHIWKLYNAEGEVDGKRPLSYRQFCRRYANWLNSKKITFHIQRLLSSPRRFQSISGNGNPTCIMNRSCRNFSRLHAIPTPLTA